MKDFHGIDLDMLFDNESEYGEEYRQEELRDEDIERAEKTMGYKLPGSYTELLRLQNGGLINDEEYDEAWLTAIYGVGQTADAYNGLEDMFENWHDEWEYPDIGIPFGETESAGHDMYYMDFRCVDAGGEPRIVRIDGEDDNAVYFIADNLIEFLKKLVNGGDIYHGRRLDG